MVYIGCQMPDPRCTKVHFSWTGTKIVLLHSSIGVTFPPFQSFLTKSSNLEPGGQLHVQQCVKVANWECQKGKAGLQSFGEGVVIWWQDPDLMTGLWRCQGTDSLVYFVQKTHCIIAWEVETLGELNWTHATLQLDVHLYVIRYRQSCSKFIALMKKVAIWHILQFIKVGLLFWC